MSTKQADKKKSKNNPPPAPGFWRRNAFSLALVALCFVIFGNSIPNSYALDDEFYTTQYNALTSKGFKSLKEIFTTRTFKNKDGSGYQYRPIALAAFAVEHQFFGVKPRVSHFFNVLLYALTVLIIFRLLRRWFAAQGDWFAFFIALLFLTHPLHTECVANIKCRDELLAMLGGFSCIWSIYKFHETGKWGFALLAPLFFAFGMLAKYTVLPLLILIPLILWFFSDMNWKKIALNVIPVFVIAIATYYLTKHLLPKNVREFQSFENPFAAGMAYADKLAIVFHVLGRYLWLLIIPHPLVYYYGYDYVPQPSWSDPVALLSVVVHIGLSIAALIGLRKKTTWGFALLFYLVNIIFYCNLIRPAPGLMAERYTYAASLGYCIAVVWCIFHFLRLAPEKFRFNASQFSTARNLILIITALYAIRSIVRNEDWESKDVLYNNDIEHLGESAKANMLLAALMAEHAYKTGGESQQLMQQAIKKNDRNLGDMAKLKRDSSMQFFRQANEYYKQATVIAPNYQIAWSNLGTTYTLLGDYKAAIPCYIRAYEVKPKYTDGLFHAAVSYDSLHMNDSALYYYAFCLKRDSAYVNAYLGWMKKLLAKDTSAVPFVMQTLLRATVLAPKSDIPWANLSILYLQNGDTTAGLNAFEKAAELNPSNTGRLRKLAEYYRKRGNTEKVNYYKAKLEEAKQKQDEMKMRRQKKRS